MIQETQFKGIFGNYNQFHLMNAMQLPKLTVVRNKKAVPTIRLALTDCVKVVNGAITDVANGNDATHEIVRLRGTARHDNNEFIVEARNLETDNIETIQLPL